MTKIGFFLVTITVFLLLDSDLPLDPESINPFDESYLEIMRTDVEQLKAKALEYYREGDFAASARHYISALSRNVDDAVNLYNLACCYGLLGEPELAAKYLELSVSAGFKDVNLILEDSDFEKVKYDAYFLEIRDSLIHSIDSTVNSEGGQLWFETNVYLDARVSYPPDFDPDEKANLIIGLHGYGSNPERFLRLIDRFQNNDFIFLCLRAPYLAYPGNEPGYGWFLWNDSDPSYWEKTAKTSVAYVCSAAEKMNSYYNIDKTFLLGFSQGCALAYMTGLKNPVLFDGIICFGGWLDTSWVTLEDISKAKGNLKVFIGHGLNDGVVDIESSREAFEILRSSGSDVFLYEFDGSHSVPQEAIFQAESWILKE
ncbi:hypothetical protein JXL83_01105 [candidate division WOR-3 bacterium]|nr:hypothetical protein [candidate division WOR-3 bacterium]